VREGEAPELAGPLVTAWQLAMFPARLTIAVVREVYRVGRRVVGG
jgi:hypothetical protein